MKHIIAITIVIITCWTNLWCHAPYSRQATYGSEICYVERVRMGDKTVTYWNGKLIKAPEYMVGRDKSMADLSWYLVH